MAVAPVISPRETFNSRYRALLVRAREDDDLVRVVSASNAEGLFYMAASGGHILATTWHARACSNLGL